MSSMPTSQEPDSSELPSSTEIDGDTDDDCKILGVIDASFGAITDVLQDLGTNKLEQQEEYLAYQRMDGGFLDTMGTSREDQEQMWQVSERWKMERLTRMGSDEISASCGASNVEQEHLLKGVGGNGPEDDGIGDIFPDAESENQSVVGELLQKVTIQLQSLLIVGKIVQIVSRRLPRSEAQAP